MAGAGASTPMMQQYLRLKQEAGDAFLFFRLGDFYEMFHDDAVRASKLLEITLTARGREQGGEGYPMCGVPHQSVDQHVARLVRAGHSVALCDQVEDPRAAKGVVRRAITRIVTPATSAAESALAPHESSFLTAVLLEQGRIGLAHADVSTGELRFSEADPEADRERVLAELADFAPREVLVPSGTDRAAVLACFRGGAAPPVTEADPWTFSRQAARDALAEQFRVAGLGAFGLEGRPAATRALGGALHYLRHTQRADLAHLEAPRHVDRLDCALVDPTTRRNLELVENLRDGGRAGTLLSVLDRTRTAMGARTLRAWLAQPLLDPAAIAARHDAVEELVGSPGARESLAAALDRIADLERLLSRCVMGSASPRDLLAMGLSLEALPALVARLESSGAELLRSLAARVASQDDVAREIVATLVDSPPALARDGGLVRDGRDAELDRLRSIARDARGHLARLETRERERTGIASLKVRHNKVFGYYLEVTQANLDRVPADYERRQTLAGGERFVIPELKEMEQTILHAQERSLQLEIETFQQLRSRVATRADAVRETGRAVGVADALLSLAEAAAAFGYRRPAVDGSTTLSVKAGRHPVVERMNLALAGPGLGDGRFVPNDTEMSGDERQLVVLTGPNMGGKSTYLRQVALITLMAQAGSFVPADAARIGVADRIFTRVGASDSLATGQSTFMVEMTETARILNEATPRSLVVLDEIGRGTATFDGLSLAWAVAEHLHETASLRPRTLFATHYHELTELALLYPRVRNLRMATREWKDDIVFLHRVEEGAGDRSYGIQVARLAGLPPAVIARAREVLGNLMEADLDPTGRPRLARHEGEGAARPGPSRVKAPAPPQLSLFGAAEPDPRLTRLAERLADVDADELSPRQAHELLALLRDEARRALDR